MNFNLIKPDKQMKHYLKTNQPNTEIKIELKYSKGGINYFNSKNELRGYYLHAQPVEREIRENGITIERYTPAKGYKALILETKRQSEKSYKTALEMIEETKSLMIEAIKETNNLELI
ncbi:MAG: hypothetical protein ACR2IJ_07760 [Fluviibacter sp.]